MAKMQSYINAIRANMSTAERDMPTHEDRRGFVIGAVQEIWRVHEAKEIDESQFDRLIDVLSGFDKGSYKNFISGQVKLYKDGNPPLIVGY